jgi:hypothetical protein
MYAGVAGGFDVGVGNGGDGGKVWLPIGNWDTGGGCVYIQFGGVVEGS